MDPRIREDDSILCHIWDSIGYPLYLGVHRFPHIAQMTGFVTPAGAKDGK